MRAEEVVERLELERIEHEGGFFRRIHTGETDASGRARSTTIYALFTREEFSALHRLDAVEQFFFLDGDAFEVFRIGEDGAGRWDVLGRDFEKGESPHLVFEPGLWFGGAPLVDGENGWTLMSCVVTPGFEWEGFEIGQRDELVATYPECGDAVRRLTR
ncbi:Cupin family protein [Verrucomicrobiia bacterium DG1235]|nr:Cupin family protein [Verrucomicrobiae bacterium DG1235]